MNWPEALALSVACVSFAAIIRSLAVEGAKPVPETLRTADMTWNPIETAPKDGQVVLLCDERGNRWTDCSPPVLENGCGYPPVYWMPLPDAPKNIQDR